MTSDAKKERARYWPITPELMAQYRDGSHTQKDRNGNLIWRQNGQYHRDGDLPAKIYADGRLLWCKNGKLHRDQDKPSYIGLNGILSWYQTGQRHRFGGPAWIASDDKLEWLINGENITPKVREWLAGEEWRGTPEQIVEFQLRFA